MKPSFQALLHHYPRVMSREELFADIGWDDLIDDKAYLNTCAIRMSYGLLRTGLRLPGARMKAKAGVLAGHDIEPGQAKLSNILKFLWGAPEVFSEQEDAAAAIDGRTGLVSFWRIGGGAGGHIDLVLRRTGSFQDCARSCFWASKTIWFWSLK